MKKSILKCLSCILVASNLLIIKAFATDTFKSNFKYIIGEGNRNKIYTLDKPLVVSADSSQWSYRDGKWILATSDFHQSYCNTWANVNGKWYYLDKYGEMAQNQLFTDYNDISYYLTDDGSMLCNDYCYEPFNSLEFYAASDGSLTKLGMYPIDSNK